MSVSRAVIAEANEVEESTVKCENCGSYHDGSFGWRYCMAWDRDTLPDKFCSFWWERRSDG